MVDGREGEGMNRRRERRRRGKIVEGGEGEKMNRRRKRTIMKVKRVLESQEIGIERTGAMRKNEEGEQIKGRKRE